MFSVITYKYCCTSQRFRDDLSDICLAFVLKAALNARDNYIYKAIYALKNDTIFFKAFNISKINRLLYVSKV